MSSVPGSVSMLTRRTCLSGGAGLPLVVGWPPHATAANAIMLASTPARMLSPSCIRVLPLRFFLQPSSRGAATLRGESAPAAELTHSLFGQTEFCCYGRASVKFRHTRTYKRLFGVVQCGAIEIDDGASEPAHSSIGEVARPRT